MDIIAYIMRNTQPKVPLTKNYGFWSAQFFLLNRVNVCNNISNTKSVLFETNLLD